MIRARHSSVLVTVSAIVIHLCLILSPVEPQAPSSGTGDGVSGGRAQAPPPFLFAQAPAAGNAATFFANQQGTQKSAISKEGTKINNERDRFIMSVFESLLSTMDAKLRRVENLDKAVEHLMRKMETINSRVNRNIEKTEQVLSKLRSFDSKLYNVGNGKAVESLDSRLVAFDEKMNIIDSKLNALAEDNKAAPRNRVGVKKLIVNTYPSGSEEVLKTAASERRQSAVRLNSDLPVETVFSAPAGEVNATDNAFGSNSSPASRKSSAELVAAELQDDFAVVKNSVNRIEARLTALTGVMWPKLGYLIRSVAEIHGAIVDDSLLYGKQQGLDEGQEVEASESLGVMLNLTSTQSPSTPTTTTTASSVRRQRQKTKRAGGTGDGGARMSRIDQLMNRVDPLASVSQKMEEVWNVVVGTKSTVDNLVPKSQQLLDKTQRQERAISIIHTDLTNMADQIIGNLYEVEKTLKRTGSTSGKSSTGDKIARFPGDELPSGAGEATSLFDAGPFIHSDVDSVPLVPILEPSSIPTGSTGANARRKDGFLTGLDQNTVNGIPGIPMPAPHGKSPSVVFPSIERKPAFMGSNTSAESALRDQAYKAYSCADLYKRGVRTSGVYYVQIRGTTYWYLKVFCNMDVNDGGWTVIQRRDDYGEPRESFNRDWDDYKHGFGDVAKEFWLGNENIFMLTNSEECMLRIELEDFEGNKRFAEYSTFKLYSEKDNYKLVVGGYEGNAGDALNDPWYGSNLSPFSTYNRDNDRSSLNCASMLKGGWWWRSCGRGLNGLYISDPNDLQARQGIVWFRWRGWDYTLRRASLMIRPKSFFYNDTATEVDAVV